MKRSILGLSLFLILFNSFALPINWYHTVPAIDIPTHISFGALIGLLAVLIGRSLKIERGQLLMVFVTVFVVGALWEGTEFLRDTYYALPRGLPLAQINRADTIFDMVNNLIGGLLSYALVFHFSLRREDQTPPIMRKS